MKYNKLVRDNIPEILFRKGVSAYYRILDEAEFKEYLKKKLVEEVAEFNESESIEELADILEVVAALCNTYSQYEDVKIKQIDKWTERGGFSRRICLIETIGDDNDENQKD